MRRLVSLPAAGALAASLLAFAPSSPASANSLCVGVLGNAAVSPGLHFPHVGAATSASFVVAFTTIGTCVDVHTTPPGVGTSGLGATGILKGWCGHSSGTGSTSDGHVFSYVSAGTVLVLAGGLTGIASAVPDIPGGSSCLVLNGATNFLVSGVATKMHCGLTTTVSTLVPMVLMLHVWMTSCIVALLP